MRRALEQREGGALCNWAGSGKGYAEARGKPSLRARKDHMVWGVGVLTVERDIQGKCCQTQGSLNFCQSREIPTHGKGSPDLGNESRK